MNISQSSFLSFPLESFCCLSLEYFLPFRCEIHSRDGGKVLTAEEGTLGRPCDYSSVLVVSLRNHVARIPPLKYPLLHLHAFVSFLVQNSLKRSSVFIR